MHRLTRVTFNMWSSECLSACCRVSAIRQRIACWRRKEKREQEPGLEALLQGSSQGESANGQV